VQFDALFWMPDLRLQVLLRPLYLDAFFGGGVGPCKTLALTRLCSSATSSSVRARKSLTVGSKNEPFALSTELERPHDHEPNELRGDAACSTTLDHVAVAAHGSFSREHQVSRCAFFDEKEDTRECASESKLSLVENVFGVDREAGEGYCP